ncbi:MULTISPECIES: ABC transporter permease [Gammaproteobacteria]|uniref:ABC transporter permease n=1 Tax=Gammaproteobacteria TaxID=1236 RepID=UPI000DD0E430|nr:MULTISPECIES: ABC transporter permease [Gammaproteobacteria]RTE87351.1 ABC transporter permease [Aliidiomarina sp. B3213]TCZ92863.1 ABC transporter permease [Lysobacter sp. N42]
MLIRIALKSLLNRKATLIMTFASLLISLSLLFSIEHIRQQSKESFQSAISGTDLIVGARSGQLNLLLHSVFRVGNPTSAVTWESYASIKEHPRVSWTIPISLGDSHQGYSVIGTNHNYFEHFQFGRQQSLTFSQGHPFDTQFGAVVGAEVAQKLGYELGDEFTISHGTGGISFSEHEGQYFTVQGILNPTGTPVDQSIHVAFAGIDALHHSEPTTTTAAGTPDFSATSSSDHEEHTSHDTHDHEDDHEHEHENAHAHEHDAAQSEHSSISLDYEPRVISAFFVGIDMRAATLLLQRYVNTYNDEPLTGIIPGVAMTELWKTLSSFENILRLISFLVLIATLTGLTTTLLAAMKEREREIAILRAVGAKPLTIFALIQLEVLALILSSIVGAFLLIWGMLIAAQNWLMSTYGILISTNPLNTEVIQLAIISVILTLLIALVPSYMGYRVALTKGLTPRI